MGTTETDDLLASVEVCEALHIDRSTLSRWVQVGRIEPAMRLPGKRGAMLFSRSAVDALAAKLANPEAVA
jgi:excisionase family DNA binding protein